VTVKTFKVTNIYISNNLFF